MIVSGVKGSAAPPSLVPGLTLHRADGTFTPEADAVIRAGRGCTALSRGLTCDRRIADIVVSSARDGCDTSTKLELNSHEVALACLLAAVRTFQNPPPRVSVVRLSGVIGGHAPLRKGLSLSELAGVLNEAFEADDLKAVALAVNSPGGSPVQSALIARRIRALAAEKKVPVFAFAEDVAASGGYWLLTAADEIYADESSIVGSIGVVSAGFGFPAVLDRLGVERRVYASGRNKAALDPFQRENPDEVEYLRGIQEEIHEAFRRAGPRAARRQAEGVRGGVCSTAGSGPERMAAELGLVDGIGDLRSVLRARFGDKVKLAPGRRQRAVVAALDGTAPACAGPRSKPAIGPRPSSTPSRNARCGAASDC